MQFARLSTMARGALVSCALLLSQSPAAFAQSKHTLPLFVSASHTTLQSFVRVINRSDTAGDVTIYAYDDDGERHGPVTLSLDAHATQHFNSDSLRDGDVSKGLAGAIGNNGTVHLRLELETELDIEPLAYARPKGQGFLTSTHDIVENTSMVWNVPIFNPGSQTAQQSWLRVINVSGIDTEVTIEGLDDKGTPGAETVDFDLPANAARTLSAQELERGSDDATFDGKLGLPVPHIFSLDFTVPLRYGARHGGSESSRTQLARRSCPTSRCAQPCDIAGGHEPGPARRSRV